MTRRNAGVMLGFLLAVAAPLAAEPEHARAELIARNTTFGPGENRVALRLVPDPGWHVYWINPGDSGQSTEIEWSLPPGASALPIDWAAPHSFRFGALTSYGYSEEVLHLVTLKMPEKAPNQPVKAEASWLVCSDACIPGSASLVLDLPWSGSPRPDPRHAKAFAEAEKALPVAAPASWKASFAIRAGELVLSIAGPRGEALFFPEPNDLVDHSAPQRVALEGGRLVIVQKLSPYFDKPPAEIPGVLVLKEAPGTAYRILARPLSQ